ncbi:MAG: bifunctional metallophosphatase/5'-nucleotidase [Caldithrix sp.]|nr:bifunctional metallophosphatase/5'-nucleotidase [Caldithrix sp.]
MVIRLIILLTILWGSLLFSSNADTLYILHTTDVHGQIYPYDYYHDTPANNSLAHIYNRIVEYRKNHNNVMLLDGGDLIQGSPFSHYFNMIENSVLHPIILTMNYMGYDAFAVGNHDIEQGLPVYESLRRQSHFPWLSANGVLDDGRTYFEPYTIVKRNGIRVGIIGLTTPAIPMWLDSTLYPGINWKDMVKSAKNYARKLRPKVDLLVGLFHAGFEEAYSAGQTKALGLPNENASLLVAKALPQFDIIFAGHSHREVVSSDIQFTKNNKSQHRLELDGKSTLLINSGARAHNLGVTRIILRMEENHSDRWQIISKAGWLEKVVDFQPSIAIKRLLQSHHKKTLTYIRNPIAQTLDTLSSKHARFKDTPFVELINRAQMHHTRTDISFAAVFNDRFVLEPGPIRVKDVYNMYWYENFLYTLKMSGKQIKDFLEYSANYYQLSDDTLTTNPQMAGFNYDMAEGLQYTIDVSKTPGERISTIIHLKTQKPLNPDSLYTVAMNSYRATGGGGHLAAAGIQQPSIIYKSTVQIRTILIDYLKNKKIIHARADNNWRIIH